LAYGRKCHTIQTSDLVVAILRGEVGDAAAAVRWIDAHRTRVPMD